MTKRPLPSVFALLRDDPNPAADEALVDALPDLEAFAQAAALELIFRRGHAPALASVVIRFPTYGETLAELTTARAGDLAGGIRLAITSPLAENRRAAIRLIVAGRAAELTYLLVEALRPDDRELRAEAAEGIRRITEDIVADIARGPDPAAIAARATRERRLDQLAEAVGAALRLWDLHKEQAVLRAAAALEDRTMPALTAALSSPKSSLPRMLGDALEQPGQAWIAPLLLRALAIPETRSAVVRAISQGRNPEALNGMFRSIWLIADPVLEKACRRLQPGAWIDRAVSLLNESDEITVAQGVRLIAGIGGTPEQKLSALRKIVDAPRMELRRAALWNLVPDRSEGSTELLRVIAARGGSGGTAIAVRELRRRARRAGAPPAREAPPSDPRDPSDWPALLARYWTGEEENTPSLPAELKTRLHESPAEAQAFLRRKLASAEPLDRVRALGLAAQLAWTGDLSDAVLRAAADPHPLVRGAAIGMLVELPGPSTERLLRDALHDVDERVQANAVEAMDRLNLPSRASLTAAKLDSCSGRVRANAVRSLLRLELRAAAEALVRMLADGDPTHRLCALWVVEHIESSALWERIADLSRNDADARVRARARRIMRASNAVRT